MTIPTEKLWCFPILFITSNTCIANSLVGNKIKEPNPSSFTQPSRYKISKIGIKKHIVFPLPVLEAPSKSLPPRVWGRVHLWIGVRLKYFEELRPCKVLEDIGKSLNFGYGFSHISNFDWSTPGLLLKLNIFDLEAIH